MKYTLTMSGNSNCELVEKICKDAMSCYFNIKRDGKNVAQVEYAIAYGECGYTCDDIADGLIDISYVDRKDVDFVLEELEKMGFRGLVAITHDECYCDLSGYDNDFFVCTRIGKPEYFIDIYGEKNVNVLCDYVGQRCYKQTKDKNGQIEIMDNNFAMFTFVRDPWKAIEFLREMGIKGKVYVSHCEAYYDEPWYDEKFEIEVNIV